MNAIGIQQAMQSLPQLINMTVKNREEVFIVSDTGTVVMLEQHEWDHIQETLRLLQDKTSLKALLEGHKARDRGDVPDAVSVEDAFYDLQNQYPEKR
jgi:PHD/YefM family antitoxin component YafN of YafNO toxin-antitoxin module